MRIGKSRLNLTAGIRLSKNIFFGDGISGALAGRGIFGTTSQALAISPQFAQGAATFGTTSAAQLPYLAQGSNTFGADHSATASSATFLLDDYPNAAAAYSVRLLKSDYTGPLVRIRKDTVGQPEKDFYPDFNNELSLNSGDGGGTTLGSWIGSNNGYVVTWYSQAGISGRDATQSSASAQPQIVSSGSLLTINSKPALLGSNSYYNISVPNYSIFSKIDVYKYANAPASNQAVYGLNDGGNNNRFELRQDGTDLEFFIRENSGSFVQPAIKTQDTNQNICTTYYNEGTINAYINSVLELNSYSTGLSNPLFNQLTLFATDANGIFFNLDGYIQESIFWGVDYSLDNTDIETNINDYFNIYP